MIRLETRKCNTILTEKQQKISALSSGKIEQYEYLAGEEIQPSDQRRVIQQANFTYFPLGKAFQQQTKKSIEGQGIKHVETLKTLNIENV